MSYEDTTVNTLLVLLASMADRGYRFLSDSSHETRLTD